MEHGGENLGSGRTQDAGREALAVRGRNHFDYVGGLTCDNGTGTGTGMTRDSVIK